jgi:hypothetical protein
MPEEEDPVNAWRMELMSIPEDEDRSEFNAETLLISFTSSFAQNALLLLRPDQVDSNCHTIGMLGHSFQRLTQKKGGAARTPPFVGGKWAY